MPPFASIVSVKGLVPTRSNLSGWGADRRLIDRIRRTSRRLGVLEQLEPRMALSASPIDGRPYFDLGGSDGVAWDQPRVTVEFIDDQVRSVGPPVLNTWLLDTGANTILAFQSAVGDMQGPPAPYQTDGRFEEFGVGGSSLYDISKTYRFDFAGDSGIRNTRLDTRIISDATRDISIFGPYGIVGMPAMTERVTSFDFTPFTTSAYLMGMDFSMEVPSYSGPRYSVKLDNRFEYFPEPHVIPVGHAPPAWADIPYLTAQLQHNGQVANGNFLFDTGAQVSILNQRMAFDLGLDTNNDGILDKRDASYARDETIGGIGGQTTVPVFLIDEVHVPTEQGPDLVWTDLQWVVLDIDPGIDAVFGFDNMTSGWIEALTAGGSGYIQKAHLDFRGYEATGQGTIYFDFTPEIHSVVDPNGPGAIVEESGYLTSVSETGITDTYTLRLSTAPTANVRVSLAIPNNQQATAVDANNPGNAFLDFTPQNWSIPQTVRVAAIDDSTPESFHRTYIRHNSSSTDPAYQAAGMPRVVVNITDNDYPGVMLIPTNGETVVTEGGNTDIYQVVLTYPPTQPVTIGLENVQQQVVATALNGGGNSLVFTPQNWNVPQTVLVTAVDDSLIEGTHKAYITHVITTSDIQFQDAFVLQEIVKIIDNDDSVAPQVTDVIVGSSRWSAAFIDAIDGGGVGAGNGRGLSLVGANQLRNLPWWNIDRLYIQFSENVGASLTAAKVALAGTNLASYMTGATLEYGVAGTNVAMLKLTTPISSDAIVLTLSAAITDASGNALDGEWTTGGSTPSGNGSAGGQFNFRIDVLAGDVNDSNGVNSTDLLDDYGKRNILVTSIADSYFDVNGNGGVNSTDILEIYGFRNTILPSPPGNPSFPSGALLGPPALFMEKLDNSVGTRADLPLLLAGLLPNPRISSTRNALSWQQSASKLEASGLAHVEIEPATQSAAGTARATSLSVPPDIFQFSSFSKSESARAAARDIWFGLDYAGGRFIAPRTGHRGGVGRGQQLSVPVWDRQPAPKTDAPLDERLVDLALLNGDGFSDAVVIAKPRRLAK